MKTAGVFEAVQGKLVHGDNVAQAAHYVQSGAADIGIVALAFALAPPMRDTGSYWEVPVNAHAKLNQGGLILRWTKEAPAARTFRDYLLSAPGQSVLKRHGFMLPEK
jgi:molybdate transport system substrate-binding protein